MKNYTFLLEYESYEDMVKSIFHKTGGDIKKTKQILQKIAEEDPTAYMTAANTGKGSAARNIVRGVAAQNGTQANLKMMDNLEQDAKKLGKQARKAISKNQVKIDAPVDSARYMASRLPVHNLEKSTSDSIQRHIDKVKPQIDSKLAEVPSARKKLAQAYQDITLKGKVSSSIAQRALEDVPGKGKSMAFDAKRIEEIIAKKMAKLEKTTNPLEAESLGRQIERLSSKMGLSDALNDYKLRVRKILSRFADRSVNNNDLLSMAKDEISNRLTQAGNMRDSLKAAETLSPKSSKGVLSRIGNWLGKHSKKIIHK